MNLVKSDEESLTLYLTNVSTTLDVDITKQNHVIKAHALPHILPQFCCTIDTMSPPPHCKHIIAKLVPSIKAIIDAMTQPMVLYIPYCKSMDGDVKMPAPIIVVIVIIVN
jgi:hypothetical protein